LRKGDIFIFLEENENIMFYLDFLKNALDKSAKLYVSINDTRITINDYCIHIIKTLYPGHYRDYRPEIIYINNNIDTEKDHWEDIYIKTKMYSNRIEPVRFINNIEDIDIQELINDNYALKHTISKEKMKKWDSWTLDNR